MLGERDALGEHERSEDGTEKWWIVDSSAEFHITRSADFLRDLHLSGDKVKICLLYTSPSPRDGLLSRMPSSA